MDILGFVLVIGPLIFLHELGHYLAGRWCGVKADTFSIGFGREVAGFTDKRGTRWKLGWLPMGGYVKFAGDMSPAGLSDPAWLELPPEERNRTFQSKSLAQRAFIVLAGPLANFIVAAAIFTGFALYAGDSRPIVGDVVQDSPAAAAGLRSGDRITALDDQPVSRFEELVVYVQGHPNRVVSVRFERNGSPGTLDVQLGAQTAKTVDGKDVSIGQLGVVRASVPLWRAPVQGVERTADITWSIVQSIGQIFVGERSVKELGGPLKIAQYSGQELAAGWLSLLFLIALISVNLGFLNLLPIPMLDGGHLMFYAIEAVQRRPVNAQTMEWAFRGGLVAVLMLALVVTLNDLGAFGL